MESSSWPQSLPSNRIKAIQELTQGQPLINKLRDMRPEEIESDLRSADGVVGQILGMFDNTLSILSSTEIPYIPTGDMQSSGSWDGQTSEDHDETVKTVTPVKTKRGCYKRRKDSTTYTKLVSNPVDDGYAWRKYGQKPILNATYQRNYFRCTHKVDQGCQATKQVQMTEDKPPRYRITYNGHHTCKDLLRSPQIIFDSPDPSNTSIILNFETKGFTENKQTDTCLSSMRQNRKEGFPSLWLKHNQSYSSWDLTAQVSEVPSKPVSVMSSGVDHEDMISSEVYSSTCCTRGYDEIDDLIGNNVFSDLFELCP
ncbi:probable WRKY transcription factor 70 [Cynara cardunculus var. scolymus]|uniref:probable WRKY transcription factor 70 n=1 Tax=Cynara cardunculus var. scolymus TaxID=59895 RepID=UPI000D625F9F|nr:probable WRKY transcription factor 70 [Cynara cardunculus var. scolymus]